MVWELTPLNSSSGLSRHYFTSQGTYKVGRKDCAVTILTDKTISRVHAEIIVWEASPYNSLQDFSNIPSPEIRLKDLSKFGTFVNKEIASKPVFSLPNKETVLKDGDLITFGTINTTFRLNFIPLFFCIPAKGLSSKRDIHATVSSIGAYSTEKWRSDCTHLVVEDSSPITNDITDAVIAKKPIVLYDWLQAMMGQASSLSEIPNCSSFSPTLTLERGQEYEVVKIADTKFRETCLSGFTFVIGLSRLYHYEERLQQLLEVCGATVVPVSEMCGSIQKEDISAQRVFLLVPEGARKSAGTDSDKLRYLKEIPRLTEDKAIIAVLRGEFNASAYKFPMSPVLSSRTEETVDVADSDDEAITSHQYSKVIDSKGTTLTCKTKSSSGAGERTSVANVNERTKFKSYSEVSSAQSSFAKPFGNTSVNQTVLPIETVTVDNENLAVGRKSVEKRAREAMESVNMLELKVETKIHSKREEKDVISETNEHQISDIIFNKNLVVRNDGNYGNKTFSSKEATSNFKCFRRKNALSGNNFSDLIPFAKAPYKESDYAREMADYIREEKKRKEAEALSEDLFNADRVKRQRGTTGSSFTQSLSRQKVR